MLRHLINFKKANGTSEFCGVYFNTHLKKWVYEIRSRGKRYCSRYDSEIDAAIAAEYYYYTFYGQAVNFPNKSRVEIENLYNDLTVKVGDSTNARISKKLQGIKRDRIKTSKYVGVSRYKKTSRWIAQISFRSNRRMLGIFDEEEDDAKAYDLAAVTYFGPDAKVNFPQT